VDLYSTFLSESSNALKKRIHPQLWIILSTNKQINEQTNRLPPIKLSVFTIFDEILQYHLPTLNSSEKVLAEKMTNSHSKATTTFPSIMSIFINLSHL